MINLIYSAADFSEAKLSANNIECDSTDVMEILARCLGYKSTLQCVDEGEEPLDYLIARLASAQAIVFNSSLGLERAREASAKPDEMLAICLEGLEHVLNDATQWSNLRIYRSAEEFYAGQGAIDVTKVVAADQTLAAKIGEGSDTGNHFVMGKPASRNLWDEDECLLEAEGVWASSMGENWLITCQLHYSKVGRVGFSFNEGVATCTALDEIDLYVETGQLNVTIPLPDGKVRRPSYALVIESKTCAILGSSVVLDNDLNRLTRDVVNSAFKVPSILGTPLDYFVKKRIKINLHGQARLGTKPLLQPQPPLEIMYKSTPRQRGGVVERVVRNVTSRLTINNQDLKNLGQSSPVFSLEDLTRSLINSIASYHNHVQPGTQQTPEERWGQYWGEPPSSRRGKI